MPITAHDASIALFVRGLTSLKGVLSKTEQQIAERGISAAELLDARLAPAAPDMLTLASQVHWAAEGAKRTIERLTDAPLGSSNDDAKTFAELHQRIDAAIAQLQKVSPSDVEAGLARAIEVERPRGNLHFTGERFLREFALPHFFFHVTCAYAILRHRGIELTMGDFLGRIG
jgi:hypothetical protein